jgi:GNAT superfamily N-acetyltransferase
VKSRSYNSEDQEQILDLLLAYRLTTDVKAYPTIWRFRLLLSSRVWEPERDTRVWQDEPGRAIGFAMLWRRRPEDSNLVLDYFVHPGYDREGLISDVLTWGIRRAREIAKEKQRPLTLFTGELDLGGYSRVALAAHSFSAVAVDPQRHNVYFARSLENRISDPRLPTGYTIRSLKGVDELEEYERLYGFAGVNAEHRQEMIESEEYGHLVVANATGKLVAYCEHSISRAEWEKGAERVGWIDYVGVQAEEQGKGLGEALLLAALKNLRGWGADVAMLVTISDNVSATSLYGKVGFAPVKVAEPGRYEMEIPVGVES